MNDVIVDSIDAIYCQPYYYPRYGCKPHEPKIKPSHIRERSKCSDITDAYGNLRYQVYISSDFYPIGDTGLSDWGYNTYVYKFDPNHPNIDETVSAFLVIPENGHEFNYLSAMNDFQTCVERYTSLIDAESENFDNIEIYAKKIGYERQCLSCCGSCKWSMFSHRKHKLECCNPKNQQVFNYMTDFPPAKHPDHCHSPVARGWPAIPPSNQMKSLIDGWHCPDDPKLLPIHPNVDPNGICNNYEAKPKPPLHS